MLWRGGGELPNVIRTVELCTWCALNMPAGSQGIYTQGLGCVPHDVLSLNGSSPRYQHHNTKLLLKAGAAPPIKHCEVVALRSKCWKAGTQLWSRKLACLQSLKPALLSPGIVDFFPWIFSIASWRTILLAIQLASVHGTGNSCSSSLAIKCIGLDLPEALLFSKALWQLDRSWK